MHDAQPLANLPPKLAADTPLDDPLALLPLTRDNMRTHLPHVLRQMLSYDLPQLAKYEALMRSLYLAGAQFNYPAAALHGRDAIMQFWRAFLLGEGARVWGRCLAGTACQQASAGLAPAIRVPHTVRACASSSCAAQRTTHAQPQAAPS